MTGEFFDPKPYATVQHVCRPPEASFSSQRGWRCDCGKAYVLRAVTQHGETWAQWERSKAHDKEKE